MFTLVEECQYFNTFFREIIENKHTILILYPPSIFSSTDIDLPTFIYLLTLLKSVLVILGRRFFSLFLMTRPTLFFFLRRAKTYFYLRPTLIFLPNNGLYGQIRYKHMTPTTIVIFAWTIPILQVFTSVQMYTICVSEPFTHTTKPHNLIWLQNELFKGFFLFIYVFFFFFFFSVR